MGIDLGKIKQTVRGNVQVTIKKPIEIPGGQHCGLRTYPTSVKSEDLELEIIVGRFRSNHKNKELALLLFELALDELVQ